MSVCSNCGQENPEIARFCLACGASAAEKPPGEVRKTASIVFCDLKGSTSLGENLDAEALREILSLYFHEMQLVLERHGGVVEKYIGDAIMAVFGLPNAHEDDALRAVRAANEMQQALLGVNDRLEAEWGIRLENRTGVNTGEVVAGEASLGQRLVIGDAVNTAARLEQAAPLGGILLGESTYRLVKDAVEAEPVAPLEVKGKSKPVSAYRLVAVGEPDHAISRHFDSPLVGRIQELNRLDVALDRAEREGLAQLVTVFGPAGVGKSRLLREFLHRTTERAVQLRGRCLSYGEGITFWPLVEVVREAAGINEDDSLSDARERLGLLVGADVAQRLAAAIGLSEETFPVQETFWGVRRMLEMLARGQATVVLIEDIHWAEDTFLELLRHLVDTVEAPLVLLCSSRPDLLEEHAEWGQEGDRIYNVTLDLLSWDESEQVVANFLGSSVEERVSARIAEAAEGNPLFVEQMLSMFIDDSILIREADGHWRLTGDLSSIAIPPSISALLTARLDRLGARERAVVERGAVIGQVFYRGAVQHLVGEHVRLHVDESLKALTRKGLVRPDPASFAGEDAFRFVHILIRDAAYRGLLKRTRAELHEAFVDWLEQVVSGRELEYEEILGYHLEQACQILVKLSSANGTAARLGERGARYLSSAGRRALARGDMPAAETLMRRSAALLPPEHPEHARLLLQAGEALAEMGQFRLAESLFESAAEAARERGDEVLAETTQLVKIGLRYTIEGGQEQEVVRAVERAIGIFEKSQEHQGLWRAYRLLTNVHWTACRMAAAQNATERMIEHARLAGDELLGRRYLGSIAASELLGPSPVPKAIRRCEELLDQAQGDRKAEATIQCCLAHLRSMQGDFQVARASFGESRALFEELGWKFEVATISLDSGPAELLAGNPRAAEAELRAGYNRLEEMGEHNYIFTVAGYLAEAIYRQGRLEDAQTFARICEEHAPPDDLTSQVLWRSVRAKVLAQQGRAEDAEILIHDAVQMMRTTDWLDGLGLALIDQAEVLELAGKIEAARDVAQQAVNTFERKGNVVSAGHARARVAAFAHGHSDPGATPSSSFA